MKRVWQAFAFAVLLIVWGNAVASIVGTPIPLSWTGAAFGVTLVVLSLLSARRMGLTWAEVGLSPRTAAKGAAVGMALGLLAAAVGLVVFRFPPLLGAPVSYVPLGSLTWSELAFRALVLLPLDTVLPEEVAFRGVLLAALVRLYGGVRALVLMALAFGAWHVVIVSTSVAGANLAGPFDVIATGAALFSVTLGGLALGVLRLRLGSLAAPIVAHWTFNTALLIGLRALMGN